MTVYNDSRKNIILLVFIGLFMVMAIRLFTLQVLTSKYKELAEDQGVFRKVIYPDRGLILDRKKKAILLNSTICDLMVWPNKLKGVDTALLCKILNLDTLAFRKRIVELIIKNGRTRPSIFEPLLSDEKMAVLNESMYRFSPAFFLQERSTRKYPFNAAANVLGYIAEVDTNFLKKHPDEGYVAGDYAGMTGLERTYEKVLMGTRGIQYWKRDNKNRLTERLEKGKYDTGAIAGQNLHTSIDIELQELGEKLMQNKLGSIVAIDPKTGGVLAMVSAPTYEPNYLTGSERRKHFSELFLNPALPLLNRTISATYSPGSTFKTLQALIGLHEGVISTDTRFSCGGAFYGCGSAKPMRCLDFGTFDLRSAITVSDNTYFAHVMQRVINNPKFSGTDTALSSWDQYMYAFGLGHRLGVDLPSEKTGNIPTPKYYDKVYGKGSWNFCNFRSVSIGQGEVTVTPLQVANEMAYIANKGWYYVPHVVDSIEGGDRYGLLEKYRKKIRPIEISDSIFEAVHDGMQFVVDRGTGVGAKVKDIVICGKTGTVENYYRGVKQQNHSFFCGFAPRDNPKIAIMCVVENSGRFGGTYAAPIVGLMIEKYLKDSITEKTRKDRIEQLSSLKLMPARIYSEIRRQDSVRHSKDSAYLISKGYLKLIKDTIGLDDDQPDKEEIRKDSSGKNSNKKKAGDTLQRKENLNLENKKKKKIQSKIENSTLNLSRPVITQKKDKVLVALFIAIAVIGLLSIFSVEYREGEDFFKNLTGFKKNYSKQFFYLMACLVVATFITLMDSKFFTATPNLLYAGGILLMIATFAVGKTVNGSKSWIPLGFMNLQPVETCKIFTALALAKYMARPEMNFSKQQSQIMATGICFLPIVFSLLQNETGLALVYLSFLLPMYREGFPPAYLLIGASLAFLLVASLLLSTSVLLISISVVCAVAIYLFRKKAKRNRSLIYTIIGIWCFSIVFVGAAVPFLFKHVFQKYQADRIYSMVGRDNPYATETTKEENTKKTSQKKVKKETENYNVKQSKIAIGSGGFFGKGFLKGTQTQGEFVPEQHTDFIFTSLSESFGFIGCLVLLSLYLAMLLRIVMIAERQRSVFSRVYAYSVASILFFHIAVNICMTIGLAPVIGITLPLMSYGGSSLLTFTVLIFILVRLDADRQMVLR